MKFLADLHIHSKYSRATSKQLDLEHIYISTQIKGITVVGTGDAIHPGWFSEIKEKLVPAEPGLYRLRDDIAESCDREVPPNCRAPVRFVLQTEISNIYKSDGKTRKNHNLVYLPDIAIAEKFQKRLEAIGNIHSDGRPILGLAAKHLLEIAMEVSDKAFLIPAHIWTPWFSLLGSKSGFDSIEECFGDLSPHIFAVETGLSSDPLMNRMVSGLDGLRLVSNSDAHSPANIGREVNIFDAPLTYDGIRTALAQGDGGFVGTIEFYPEEGKYHLDGHRKCRKRLWPEETRALGDICPVCGKPLTLGVLSRVKELADRKAGGQGPTDRFYHRVPLAGVLSEILGTGPQSKKVMRAYGVLISKFGSELRILNDVAVSDLAESGVLLLSEAIERMRSGRMRLLPGYDGEYGTIRIFDDAERKKLLGQRPIFDIPDTEKTATSEREPLGLRRAPKKRTPDAEPVEHAPPSDRTPVTKKAAARPEERLQLLNPAQTEAVTHPSGPLLIVAGPGTGKTLTLTHRIAHLIKEKGVAAESVLAVTFTNKAAREMGERLARLLGGDRPLPLTATFHGFCLQLLREDATYADYTIIEAQDRRRLLDLAVKTLGRTMDGGMPNRDRVLSTIADAKQRLVGPEAFAVKDESEKKILSKIYTFYCDTLRVQRLFDFEELIFRIVTRMETDAAYRTACRDRFPYVFVDEYQDLNHGQYRLVRALCPPDRDICVIGDPDQSIYGFRGSDHRYFVNFLSDYPATKLVYLDRNYRSNQAILDAADQVMDGHRITLPAAGNHHSQLVSQLSDGPGSIHVLEVGSERAEVDAVSKTIEKLVGGAGYHSVDAGRIDQAALSEPIAFSDVAVLYRTGDQHRLAAESLSRYGIPFQVAGRSGADEISETHQLLSLFKVVEGMGHYADFEHVVSAWQPGLGKETVLRFCQWGIGLGLDLATALHEVKRFPVPEMPRHRQEKITDLVKIVQGFSRKMAGMSFSEKLKYLLTHTRIGRVREENPSVFEACERLLQAVETAGVSAESFFSNRALDTEVDTVSFDVQKVTLMTLHAAKGLEFPVVFILGCEADLIPFKRAEGDAADRSEERRLFFVGMTRAKRQLFLTWARRRKRFGKELTRRVSPFVSDIAPDLLVRQEPVYGKRKRQIQTQMKLF